jgi:uncharacterized protein with von Willebrand factor type A (vWA) domain
MASHQEQYKISKKFYDFIDILIDAGIEIPTAEVLDMFSAMKHIDFTDKRIFKQTLATTLVKDYTDLPIFERCFRSYFEKKGDEGNDDPTATILDTLKLDSLNNNMVSYVMDLLELREEIENFLENLSDHDIHEMSPEEILNLLLDNSAAASTLSALGMMILNARSRGAPYRDDEGPLSGERISEIQQLLLQHIRRIINERGIGRRIIERENYLLNKYIYQLTPEEVKEMRELVKRFGQKLKNRISLRKRRVKHGGIDIKRIIRKNLQYGGTPFKIYYKDRKIDRPQLVVLCDISSSVNQYSRFMLLLTYTLQSLFSKVRTFAFISNMVEITSLFIEMEPERALNSIFTDNKFTYGWGSNYGRCFNQFMKEYSNSLTSKTTVLILGDARNNYQDPGLDSFRRMGSRVRNILWLNPDSRHLWDWGDSIASIYVHDCTEMKEVNSFIDLSEFIDKLFV